jgi:hypothetical protein
MTTKKAGAKRAKKATAKKKTSAKTSAPTAPLRTRARDLLARSVGGVSALEALEAAPGPRAGTHLEVLPGLEKPMSANDRLERSEAWMSAFIEQLGDVGAELYAVRDQLLADAQRGLHRIDAEGPDVALDAAAEIGLEAIIETDGTRPVFLVQDNALNPQAIAAADQWADLMTGRRAEIERIAKAVGRVNDKSAQQRFQGTAFVVAPGFVMTNRHVLQAIASRTAGKWTFKPGIDIDFGREYQRDRELKFGIREVVFAGEHAVNPFAIDHDILDLVLLRLADPEPGRAWPQPLPIVIRPEADSPSRSIVSCGFPGDPSTNEPADLKMKLFQLIFGYKVLAPGRIKFTAGEIEGNARKWSLGHDATTLPGNSGSCLIDIEAGPDVVALHYAGQPRIVNFAHVLGVAGRETMPGTGKTILEFLKSQGATIRA